MNRLVSLIQEEIRRDGPVSFARFMELALYAPGLGYYECRRDIGQRGDFFTSVSTGPLFGELLAFQFSHWLRRDSPFDKLLIVEAGAHDGALAADILGWLQRRQPELFARLEYCLVEPSPRRRAWQEETLRGWLPKITFASAVAEAGASRAHAILFCNELLDAMPAHRLAWNAAGKKWEECRVACGDAGFVWQRATPGPGLAGCLPVIGPELAGVLPDGYAIELSPAAAAWWRQAATALAHGKLLTLDYGLTDAEQFRPERAGGTLRTYARHHAGGDLLDNPGQCDITAHVNFSAIEAAGRAAGLETEGLMGQEKFLTQILAQTAAEPGGFDGWTPARTRQFQTLTHPEHLGRAFRVLIQSTAADAKPRDPNTGPVGR